MEALKRHSNLLVFIQSSWFASRAVCDGAKLCLWGRVGGMIADLIFSGDSFETSTPTYKPKI